MTSQAETLLPVCTVGSAEDPPGSEALTWDTVRAGLLGRSTHEIADADAAAAARTGPVVAVAPRPLLPPEHCSRCQAARPRHVAPCEIR